MIYVFELINQLIYLRLYYYCSNLFSVQFKKLRCSIFRNTFSLEFYTYEIQNFEVYRRQNFEICRNLFSCSAFSSFFFIHSV